MQEPLLEDLFAAFRDRGDAAALAAVFDRTAGELLTLALHLAPETSAAEDLVQATFLAAIQGAATFERGRRLMPWLVGILANQAARARRDRARVVDPARVEARPEPDPALASEQREILATLTRAIDQLPDTCRASVRRHLLDGERAVDIARAEGLAPGTVRMQILRGLERLKRTLPANLLSAGSIVIETGRMTQIRGAVLSAARAHTGLTMTSASASLGSTGPVLGGAVVTLKLCIAAVVLMLVGLVAWRTSERSTPDTVAAPSPASLASSDISATGSPARSERAVAPAAASTWGSPDAPIAASARSGWWLNGTVLGIAGLDATQTTIRVSALPGSFGGMDCRAGADGRFSLEVSKLFGEDVKPDYLLVYASHPEHRDANANVALDREQVSAGLTRRVEWNVELELVPFAILVGRVDVPAGDVPQSTAVVLFQKGDSPTEPAWKKKLASTQRHGDGTFELRVDGDGDALLVVQAEGFVPACASVHFERGVQSNVGTLQLVRGEVSVEGRVEWGFAAVGTNRGPAADVDARRPGPKSDVDASWHGVHLASDAHGIPRVTLDEQRSTVDSEGAFRFHGLPPGEWEIDLEIAHVIQLGPRTTKCVVPCPPIVLGRELDRWSIRVVSHGKPVPDAVLVATCGEQSVRATVDAEGQARVVAPFSAGWELVASAPGFADKHVTVPASKQAFDGALDVELARADDPRATLVLRLADASGKPDSAQVTLQPIGSEGDSIDKMFRDGAGPYEMTDVPPGRWSVLVQPSTKAWFGMPGGSELQDVRFDLVIEPRERHVETITFEKGGRVEIEVDGWSEIRSGNGPWARMHLRDAAQRTVACSVVVRESNAGSLSLVAYDDQIALYAPSALRASLPAGAYTIELDDPQWTANPVSFQVKAGETTKVRVAVARR